ncbi:hypothetical protein KAZ57_01355 [Patescibacteria group bacterium]|nr:hypothetical protein [Patescibacteria group bacterium]
MRLHGKDLFDIVDMVLKHTKEGPITQWDERIAQLAKNAGLEVEQINWKGSPKDVAFKVVEHAETFGTLEELKQAISERTNKQGETN